MPTTIDSLEISIGARATTANNALDKLIQKLGDLDTKLGGINGGSLDSLSRGIDSLSSSMKNLDNSGVKTQDFTRLTKNINQLGSVDYSKLYGVGQGLALVTSSFNALSNASATAGHVTDMINAVSKLGYASVDRAISNMPRLSVALRDMLQMLSTVPEINGSLIQMTNAIANLASQGGKVRSAAANMAGGFNQISTTATRTKKSLTSLASVFGRFYATYFLVIRGLKGVWKSIESSMDYVETYNYLNVSINEMGKKTAEAMGDVGEESAKAYAKEFRNTLNELNEKMTGYTMGASGELIQSQMSNIGLNPEQLQNFQAKIGAMTTSVGLLGTISVKAQKGLSMLAADLSSLTNTDLETTMSNLTSGLMGMSRSLYKYGLDITNASLAQTAARLGIEKSVTAMSQSEKMQLRLLTILENSQVAWGDVANTVGSVANQYRIFKQQISNLGRILGNLFIPIIQKALPIINGMIVALQNLFQMLGFQLHGETWLTGIMDGISGGTSSIDDLGEGVEGLEEDLDGATSSAKKLKQQLQGFDELNVLTTKDSSGSAIGGLGIDMDDKISNALADYESVWNKAFEEMENKIQKYANKFNKILEPLKGFWALLSTGNFFAAGGALSTIVSKIFNGLAKAISKVDWRKIGNKIGDFLAGIRWKEVLSSVGNFFEKIIVAAADLWKGSFDTNPLATAIVTSLLVAKWTGLSGLFDKIIASAIPGSISVGKTITLVGITFTLGVEVGKWIGEHIFDDTPETYREFRWFGENGFFKTVSTADSDILWDAFRNMFKDNRNESILESFNTSPFAKYLNKLDDKLKEIIDDFEDAFGVSIPKAFNMWKEDPFGTPIYLGLKAIATMVSYANTVIKNLIANIADLVAELKPSFFEKLSKLTVFPSALMPSLSFGRTIQGFATGGFPSADLFFANEYGVPELVGTINNKPAVVSNTEISGISDAVYSTGETQSGLLQTAVNLLQVIASNGNGYDSERVFNDVRRSAYSYTARTGNSAFPI